MRVFFQDVLKDFVSDILKIFMAGLLDLTIFRD